VAEHRGATAAGGLERAEHVGADGNSLGGDGTRAFLVASGLSRHRSEHACSNVSGGRDLDGLLERSADGAIQRDALAARLTLTKVIVDFEGPSSVELAVGVGAEETSD